MSTASEPVGTLEVALAHASRLLETKPALAAEQATEILKAVPGHPFARLILGAARRLSGPRSRPERALPRRVTRLVAGPFSFGNNRGEE